MLWQASTIASDYWLAYETSEERAQFFNPSVFISIYAIIVVVSVLLIVLRSYSFMILGLKIAHIFFSQILHSILHAPMSLFDTTPSGRILSRVRIRRLIVCYSKCHICIMTSIDLNFDRYPWIRPMLMSLSPCSSILW